MPRGRPPKQDNSDFNERDDDDTQEEGVEGAADTEGDTPPLAVNTPPLAVNTPPVDNVKNDEESGKQDRPRTGDGKQRVKCAALKNKRVIAGNGEIIQFDEDGIVEVEAKEAERLLTIPGFEEA